MGVPADKTTKSKRNKRRSHLALTRPGTATCPQCGELKVPHRVCTCGYYKGKEILPSKLN
ncbi:MAG: 50S ribosomal protein L32 [Oligoflexia bacterium]|nr:50S ribosomal protein L32 [Oligoflexia bacterium]